MNQFSSQSSKKKPKRPINNNFLEALRDLGGEVVDSATKDFIKGVPESAFNQIAKRQKAGELRPNQPLELGQIPQENLPERSPLQFQREFLDIQRESRLVYKREEQETKLQIAAVLEELKSLSLSTKNLAKEVEVASKQIPVDPGTYHLNFFEKLRQTLIVLRKKIDESATWLSVHNRKSQKRNYYWGQVKKSGTKFMLSSERYMATQAG